MPRARRSAVVPFVPGEEAQDRHQRRLEIALGMVDDARRRLADLGLVLKISPDGGQHRWTTTVKLALEIQGLAESPGAEAGAIAERMAAHAHYDADVAQFGVDVAAHRMRLRVRGIDPDREALDPSPVQ